MALKNVFGDLALETTNDNISIETEFSVGEVLSCILDELKILNMYMSQTTDITFTKNDLE